MRDCERRKQFCITEEKMNGAFCLYVFVVNSKPKRAKTLLDIHFHDRDVRRDGMDPIIFFIQPQICRCSCFSSTCIASATTLRTLFSSSSSFSADRFHCRVSRCERQFLRFHSCTAHILSFSWFLLCLNSPRSCWFSCFSRWIIAVKESHSSREL